MNYEFGVHENLSMMVTIVGRERGEKIAAQFSAMGITFNLLLLGKGTANSKMLDYFGLADTEKDVLLSLIPTRLAGLMLNRMSELLELDKPGHGIAFTHPVTHICGPATGKYMKFVEEKPMECDVSGGNKMEQSHSVVMAVVNRGYSEEVMDAAHLAGATGGTVLHARGVGMKAAEKFFGITIQPEKEIVLIVVNEEIRKAVSEAIANKRELMEDGRPFVFSLPAGNVVGMSSGMPKPE